MPRLLPLIFILFAFSAVARAQAVVTNPVRHGTGIPTTCTVGRINIDDSTGIMYTRGVLGVCTPSKFTGGVLTTPLLAANGTAGAPSYSFSSDTDTGIYRTGTNSIGFSNGGVIHTLPALAGTLCGTGAVCTGYQASLGYTAENSAKKDESGGYVGLTSLKINFKNAANTFTSFLQNSNTAARTYTFGDRDGTIADRQYVDDSIAALPVGVQNSAGAGVVPVSDGTNLVASDVTNPSPGNVAINGGGVGGAEFSSGDSAVKLQGNATNRLWLIPGQSTLGDANSAGNGTIITVADGDKTITQSAGTESIAVDGVGHTITNTAATSFSVVSPLFGVGVNGNDFLVGSAGGRDGVITKYGGQSIDTLDTLVGDSADGVFKKKALVAGNGITLDNTGTLTVTNSKPGPAVTCSNTNPSTAITGTASKTYFNVRCFIPADTLTAGKTIKLEARGVYSSAVANTLVNAVDICQVDGCGSGTVVNLATTAAVTPGAITNQGWLLDENGVVYGGGATGQVDVQGYAAYQTASLVITFDPTPNTSAATVNMTVDQYLSVAVTFSTNSGSNSITLRNFKVIVQ